MGWRKNDQEEATFFRNINRHLLEQAGARWDNPESFAFAFEVASQRAELEGFLKRRTRSWRKVGYWGFNPFDHLGLQPSSTHLWGWKDPRNCLTLGLWLSLFPSLKVIHLFRNGVDVAASLQSRESRRNLNQASRRCLDLEGGFSLWIAYETVLRQTLETLPSSHVHSLRYEALVESPGNQIDSLCEFLGHGARPRQLQQIIAEVETRSANAYRRCESLTAFHAKNAGHPLMSRFNHQGTDN